MSLAAAVFTKQRAFLISDLRTVQTLPDDSLKTWADNQPKVLGLTPHLGVACCGTLDYLRYLFTELRGVKCFEEGAGRIETFTRSFIAAGRHETRLPGGRIRTTFCQAILLGWDGGGFRCALWNDPTVRRQEIAATDSLNVVAIGAPGPRNALMDRLRALRPKSLQPDALPAFFGPLIAELATEHKEISAETLTVVLDPQPTPQPKYAGLVCTSGSVTRRDGLTLTELQALWTAPADQFVLSGGFIEMWIKKSADDDTHWRLDGRTDGTDEEYFYSTNVAEGVLYDIRIRAVNAAGAHSAWATVTNVLAVGGAPPPKQSTDITNPNFEVSDELPPVAWIPTGDTGGFSWDTSTPYEGTRSLVITTTGTEGAIPWNWTPGSGSAPCRLRSAQTYVVRPGDRYTISAAMKKVSGAGAKCRAVLTFWDASGSLLDSVIAEQFNTSWGIATATGEAPSGASYATVDLTMSGWSSSASGAFDSVKLALVTALDGPVVWGTLPAANLPARTGAIEYVIDGGGAVIATGLKGQISIPAACTVTGWVLTADAAGSAVVDVKRSTYSGFPTTASIAGSDKPTLSSVQKNENAGPLSSWGSVDLAAGDIVQFNVDSCTTCQRLVVTLNLSIPA